MTAHQNLDALSRHGAHSLVSMFVCVNSLTHCEHACMCAVAHALPKRARLCAHVALSRKGPREGKRLVRPAVGRPRRFRSGRARYPGHVQRNYWPSPSQASQHYQPKPWTLNPPLRRVIITNQPSTRNSKPSTLDPTP